MRLVVLEVPQWAIQWRPVKLCISEEVCSTISALKNRTKLLISSIEPYFAETNVMWRIIITTRDVLVNSSNSTLCTDIGGKSYSVRTYGCWTWSTTTFPPKSFTNSWMLSSNWKPSLSEKARTQRGSLSYCRLVYSAWRKGWTDILILMTWRTAK